MLENPMVVGDYYRHGTRHDSPETRLEYVRERRKQADVVAAGLHMNPYDAMGVKDYLEDAFRLFFEKQPDTIADWIDEWLELDPQHDAYRDWLRTATIEI